MGCSRQRASGAIHPCRRRPTVLVDYSKRPYPAHRATAAIGCVGPSRGLEKVEVRCVVSVPSHVGGVTGATLQVSNQLGAAVSFALQAGLFTANDGGISDFDNISASLYFEMGFVALWMTMFLVLYRSEKKAVKDGETGEDGR
ncbi:hypothetical protein L198_07565 [Cryptococcus wingfieldii CBS 7118]|uniref:Uncharacterized protein n=1 Tax=Cryptococcus wingfieldii CBS 7118 TaxID=1295528 RepID=A0A1E3IA63_9TREE|nr:hypothetical protein L198_07565 [Cryptococcus wingfieldii CBS 7118]ODN85482.1 hypothetical protein L198_07565 [Cryptococcus wingfieldii CBS 7118]